MAGSVTDLRRVHILVQGRVQGVFFRAQTCEEARKLGLVGWVANAQDGRVEIMAEGEKDKLEGLIAWCKKGPLLANVTDVEVSWQEAKGEFSDFEMVY